MCARARLSVRETSYVRARAHTYTYARMDVGPFEVVPRQRPTITQQNVPRVFVFLRQSLGNTRSTRH